MEKVQLARKPRSHDVLTVARAYRLPGVANPEVVDDLPNELNIRQFG